MEKSDVFAAHIKDERVQSVREHCENVAEYAAQEAGRVGLSDTLKLAGLLHDLGKTTHIFNNYIHRAVLDSGYVQKVNHSSAGGRYLYEKMESSNGMDMLVKQLIAYAVVSHHGLSDLVTISGENYFEKRLYPDKDNFYDEVVKNQDFLNQEKIRELFVKAVDEITVWSGKIVNLAEQMKPDNAAGHFLLGALQRLILSFLVDADWRDTSEFMDNRKYERLSEQQILQKWIKYQNRLGTRIGLFKQHNELQKLRKEMSDLCYTFAEQGNGIYRLAIPTGGGKTLAGMRYALELAKKEKKKHLYYIAPYLSILEQNAHEIKNIFKDDEYVLEFHSNVIVSENDEQGRQFSEDWSEPVILTTMVQFLNTMFSGSMKSVRRFHQLADSVIILDEAQSIPVKCLCMFTTMVNFLSACCNTTVIICTATQPLFEKLDDKLLYSQPADIIPEIDKYYDGFKRTEVVNRARIGVSTEKLADMVLEVLDNNVLVILNTKSAVQELFEEIYKRVGQDVEVFQLTTYMCAAHRMERIERIKSDLKEGNKKIICVSTQLIEAGVDISFETVIRSLAGLDSIAQAAGRCNRNAERQQGNVYVVDYERENVSRLKDIKLAQDATRLVFDRFQGDLLSQSAMNLYYVEYFPESVKLNIFLC